MRHILYTALILLSFSRPAWALKAYSGKIVALKPSLKIALETGEFVALKTDNDSLVDDLARLSLGDYLHFQGIKYTDCINLVMLEHIDLYALPGTWQSQHWQFFTFSSDRKLSIQQPFDDNKDKDVTHYNFAVYPGQDDYWTIIMANDLETKVGTFKLNHARAELRIIIKATQESEEFFELHRVQ